MPTLQPLFPTSLLGALDLVRLDASRRLDPAERARKGQFFTPASVARLMASMFQVDEPTVRILDAGAGIGVLTAALVAELCGRPRPPERIAVTAFEIEPVLVDYLEETFAGCAAACSAAGVGFQAGIRRTDFIEFGSGIFGDPLLHASDKPEFDAAILNPPYRKIRSDSPYRSLLSRAGIETGNLYSAFLALVVRMLAPGGELVAITPRSFCNGPYFRPFRRLLLSETRLRRVHVYKRRDRAFGEDDVLQENIILHVARGARGRSPVTISSSEDPHDASICTRRVPYPGVVRPDDPEQFIRLATDELDQQVLDSMEQLHTPLDELGIAVSTGRVVDFRARRFLRAQPDETSVPLVYPTHMQEGFVSWPSPSARKPNALAQVEETEALLVPSGHYVLVKRFSAKEERRRVTAAVFDPSRVPCERVGFENHLNYFHREGGGLAPGFARGLAAFLNSSYVDHYFRQFSGHTQVNATDLRRLTYPTVEELEALGRRIGDRFPDQAALDRIIDQELECMSTGEGDPIRAREKIEQALQLLRDLGLPRGQQNERSALTLLALLDVRPDTSWANARDPLRGITEMMDYFAEHFGKTYAPNTRETIRRQTVHQFVQAGLALLNPDDADRPTNSPKTVYRIALPALKVIRCVGRADYAKRLKGYLRGIETLKRTYAQERNLRKIPVRIPGGGMIELSSGGQNVLVKLILDSFCPRFTPGAYPIYVGDTARKWAHFDREALGALGVTIEEHGKMPDVVVHFKEKDWLVLIEAVTSHGPVDPKRKIELEQLFTGATAGIVYVTTFLDRSALVKFLGAIAWETEVWVADAPDHLIHFNGERFLGPYPE